MSMSRKLKFNTKQLTGHGGIRLEFISREACEVFIAGSFNDWQPASTPMIAVGNGHWLKELVLAPGRYEYRLVVDGQWTDDPSAKESQPEIASDLHCTTKAIEMRLYHARKLLHARLANEFGGVRGILFSEA